MAITQLTGKQIKDQSIDLTTDVTGVLPTANGGTPQYILLQDQKTSGTNGGSIGSGNTWFQRNINTIAHDDTGAVTISSNSFTLPAGTYEVQVQAPFMEQNEDARGRLRLYNVTDSAVIAYGASLSPVASLSFSLSPGTLLTLRGKFTLAAPKTLRVDMYTTDNVGASYALGAAVGISGVHEIYTEVELHKVE